MNGMAKCLLQNQTVSHLEQVPFSHIFMYIGQWSGVFVGWYLDEWEPFKTSTKRDKFLKYFYDPDAKEYIPGTFNSSLSLTNAREPRYNCLEVDAAFFGFKIE